MKKIISSFIFLIIATICPAQVKYSYCDVYARGSWKKMKITIIHNNKIHLKTSGNISSAINAMADQGWVLDESIVIPRHGLHITRHKLHFIMKKENRDVPSSKIEFPSNAGLSTNNNTTTNINKTTSNTTPKESLSKSFKNGEIYSADKQSKISLEKKFIAEIKSDINTAQNKQDIVSIKEKIDVLTEYHQKMEQKGSYYNILDAIQSLNIQLDKKAKKLGTKL